MNITSALIVDDSKMARVTLKKHLESLNIKVFIAESSEQSLEFLKTNHPDVIFMDCLMPGIDGFETTRLISSNPDTAAIPVIMCTGKESDEDKHKAMDAGAFSYMTKSSSAGPLKDILADLDKFDAQMSRITSTLSVETTEQKSETVTEKSAEPLTTDEIIKQTLAAAENILTDKLALINSNYNQLSSQFSALSSQLEDKMIISIKSSIKESHIYTDSKAQNLITDLQSLRQDFDTFKQQIEKIDFDELIIETLNTHMDQQFQDRRSELSDIIIAEDSVQNRINDMIQKQQETERERISFLENKIEQATSSSKSLFIGLTALFFSLSALAVSAYLYLK